MRAWVVGVPQKLTAKALAVVAGLVVVALVSPAGVSAQEPTGDGGPPRGPSAGQQPPTSDTTVPSTTTSTTLPDQGAATSTTVPETVPEDDFREPGDTTIPPVRREQLVPPPIDLTSVNQLLEGKREEAVGAATEVADAANADAMNKALERTAALEALSAEIPALDRAVEDARATERSAVAALERARSRKADLAVESYTLALSGTNVSMDASVQLLEDSANFEHYVRITEYSGAVWSSLDRRITAARAALDGSEAATQSAIEARGRIERRIGAAQGDLDAAVVNAETVAAEGEEAVAVAAATGADLAAEGLGPTIIGETLLTPEDLAAFSARRSGAAPSVDLLELARLFVFEGSAEGVRGDIAWAQSILETGNFGYAGSMVSTSDNNYAGIGACDSCASGFSYPTPQLGVRAQIQLLHTYANDNLRATDLAFPPAGKPPERSSVRGCCDTWMELSGVWATGPGYGVKILTIYNEMLAFAAQRQREGLSVGAFGPPAPPALPAPDVQGGALPFAAPGPGG